MKQEFYNTKLKYNKALDVYRLLFLVPELLIL